MLVGDLWKGGMMHKEKILEEVSQRIHYVEGGGRMAASPL